MPKPISPLPRAWRLQARNLTPAQRQALLARRDQWLGQIAPSCLFYPLLDLLPGVFFFAKNRQGELMLSGSRSLDLYHLADEAELVGLTDFDLNPGPMAEEYLKDDARIYATGQPLLRRVELWFDPLGTPDWFLVYKLPLRDRDGAIIGIMGFLQSYEGRAALLPPLGPVAKAVEFIRQDYQKDITLGELARRTGISSRQLQRRFKSVFGIGPWQFLIKTRLLAACKALEAADARSLAEIALACGFCDQSAFAHHFHAHLGLTPSRFRAARANV
jgi:AraC-like DNA-binding protein